MTAEGDFDHPCIEDFESEPAPVVTRTQTRAERIRAEKAGRIEAYRRAVLAKPLFVPSAVAMPAEPGKALRGVTMRCGHCGFEAADHHFWNSRELNPSQTKCAFCLIIVELVKNDFGQLELHVIRKPERRAGSGVGKYEEFSRERRQQYERIRAEEQAKRAEVLRARRERAA